MKVQAHWWRGITTPVRMLEFCLLATLLYLVMGVLIILFALSGEYPKRIVADGIDIVREGRGWVWS